MIINRDEENSLHLEKKLLDFNKNFFNIDF